jgi:hypothetical protein
MVFDLLYRAGGVAAAWSLPSEIVLTIDIAQKFSYSSRYGNLFTGTQWGNNAMLLYPT